ncbi:MAG: type II toxin-antitoxin system RelE/ParE family toxin [Acidobacteriota bacterium]
MAERFEVFWSQSAVRDLDEILDFVAREASIDQALALYAKVRERVASLTTLPRRCRYAPELESLGLREFRESLVPPYRIFFRLVEERVILVGILDSRRDLGELLIQRALEEDST